MRGQIRFLSVLTVLLALAEGSPCASQAPAPQPTPPTLADSLAIARLPEFGGAVLVVDAAKVSLPQDTPAPEPGASVADTAQAYGRIAQNFGGVTAVAPPTMAVLNTQPVAASPFAGLPSAKALKLLLATLTEDQWKRLTGERGIAFSDLATDDQRALFEDVLPPAPWKVIPTALIGTVHHEGDDRDLTAERPQARLRLRLHIGLNLPATDGKSFIFVSPPSAPRPAAEGGHVYHFMMSFDHGSSQIGGIPIRVEVPNTPKESQLGTDREALQVRVPLAGLHTVGDLVSRVAGLARLEIYADAHYEKKALTILGKPTAARAADLLRALALCLTAAYRQVGPAYMLTDDIQGVGTRRQRLAEFSKDLDARRQAALDRARTALTGHSALDLPPADPALALSADERKQIESDKVYQMAGFIYQKIPFSALSASQQQAVRNSTGRDETGEPIPPDLTAQATLSAAPLTEWVLPSLDGPITGETAEDLLRAAPPNNTAPANTAEVAAVPLPSWLALMRAIPQRALHVHPRTAAQADADVAAAKTLGLNQIWVEAFADGKVREVPLDEAVKAARSSNVQVFAVLNLLNWGPKASADLADLTILGETSAQAESREQDRQVQIALDKGETLPARATPDIMVSLFAPTVRQTLLSLVTRLSAKPGLAGMVWRETDPAGYTLLPGSVYDDRPALGSTPAARLMFLRQEHIDPIDLATSQILLMGTDTSLPLYEGAKYTDEFYAPLAAKWRLMRSEANIALLRDLYTAAQSGRTRPQIMIQDRGDHNFEGDGWYGSWDSPKVPPPAFVDPWNHPAEGQPAYSWDTITQARPQSRTVLTRLPLDGLLFPSDVNAKVGLDVQKIAEQRAAKPKTAWDGFVLESAQEALPELPLTAPMPARAGGKEQ